MGLDVEAAHARDWIKESLNFEVDAPVSVFEATIRFLGGLLSAHALTSDQMYIHKAIDLADRLLPAFRTATGVPSSTINLKTGEHTNWGWAPKKAAVLAEIGTIELEFTRLSDVCTRFLLSVYWIL